MAVTGMNKPSAAYTCTGICLPLAFDGNQFRIFQEAAELDGLNRRHMETGIFFGVLIFRAEISLRIQKYMENC